MVEGYPSSVCEGGPSTCGGRVVYVMLFEGLHVMHTMYFLLLTEGASDCGSVPVMAMVTELRWVWVNDAPSSDMWAGCTIWVYKYTEGVLGIAGVCGVFQSHVFGCAWDDT